MLYKDIMYKIASYFSPNFIVEITEMVTNLDNVTIFDIGFYEGSFSRDIIDSLNAKKINVFSFDPNTQVNTNKFEEFIRDKNIEWKHFDLAVGNLDSEEKFTILKNFPPSGSSVNNILVDSLWLKTRKFILFPFSNKKNDIETVQVQQRKIDSLDLNISRLIY